MPCINSLPESIRSYPQNFTNISGRVIILFRQAKVVFWRFLRPLVSLSLASIKSVRKSISVICQARLCENLCVKRCGKCAKISYDIKTADIWIYNDFRLLMVFEEVMENKR